MADCLSGWVLHPRNHDQVDSGREVGLAQAKRLADQALEPIARRRRPDLFSGHRDSQTRVAQGRSRRRRRPGPGPTRNAAGRTHGGSLWGLFNRSCGRNVALAFMTADRSLEDGNSGSRTTRGALNRSRIKRPRRTMCQIKSTPNAAIATRPVPSRMATARPIRGRASGRSSRSRRSRLRGGSALTACSVARSLAIAVNH